MNNKYKNLGEEVGKLVDEKNQAYGNSFSQCGDFLKLLYPEGIKPEQYGDMLCVVRIFDKLKRIATKKGAFNESAYRDLAGYALLGLAKDMEEEEEKEKNEKIQTEVTSHTFGCCDSSLPNSPPIITNNNPLNIPLCECHGPSKITSFKLISESLPEPESHDSILSYSKPIQATNKNKDVEAVIHKVIYDLFDVNLVENDEMPPVIISPEVFTGNLVNKLENFDTTISQEEYKKLRDNEEEKEEEEEE